MSLLVLRKQNWLRKLKDPWFFQFLNSFRNPFIPAAIGTFIRMPLALNNPRNLMCHESKQLTNQSTKQPYFFSLFTGVRSKQSKTNRFYRDEQVNDHMEICKTYIHQLCADIGNRLEDLPKEMFNKRSIPVV